MFGGLICATPRRTRRASRSTSQWRAADQLLSSLLSHGSGRASNERSIRIRRSTAPTPRCCAMPPRFRRWLSSRSSTTRLRAALAGIPHRQRRRLRDPDHARRRHADVRLRRRRLRSSPTTSSTTPIACRPRSWPWSSNPIASSGVDEQQLGFQLLLKLSKNRNRSANSAPRTTVGGRRARRAHVDRQSLEREETFINYLIELERTYGISTSLF